jgi:hypothetical protein
VEECPTGTHGFYDGACIPPSVLPCFDPSDPTANTLGDDCEFTYLGTTLTGSCFGDGVSPAACLAECNPTGEEGAEDGFCENPNSVCQATGIIGDPAADYVCIPNNTFTDAGQCPSGTHEVAKDDGTYQCVSPSGVACAGLLDLDSCSFDWGTNAIAGTCYQGACLADCTATGDDCGNANSVCQATGVIGDPATDYICIPDNTFVDDDTCPTGTFEVDQGNGTFQCVAPSGVACFGAADLDACEFGWGDNVLDGTCFQGACLAECTGAGDDCGNGNSVCQATGIIGDPSSAYVCIPANTFVDDNTCPTGTHEALQDDGTFQCVAPSGIACLGLEDLDTCDFGWGDNALEGTCYQGACLAECSMSGDDCGNGNSVCQATGVVGAPSTAYVCIPSNTFVDDNTCPSGTHEAVQPDGTYQCVSPSGVACAGSSDLDACSFDWGANVIGGTCFQAACLETCDPVTQTGCLNANSVCQATGIIGDPSTQGVCIPASTFTGGPELCPTGTHSVDSGEVDGTGQPIFNCVAPSALSCLNSPAQPLLGFKPNGASCTFNYFGDEVSGNCFGANVVTDPAITGDGNPVLGEDGFVMVETACVASCDPVSQTGCVNPNSTCQATGIIGGAGTIGVCIPNNTFTESAASCPSGLFPVLASEAGDPAVYNCVAPSGLACLNDATNPNLGFKVNGSECGFSYFGDTVEGACFGADPVIGPDGQPVVGADGFVMVSNACVDTCDPVLQVGCANPNSTCQATGIIGAEDTIGVCIPNSTFSESPASCPTGTHPVATGNVDGRLQPTYNCVAPSGIACLNSAAEPSLGFKPNGSGCSFNYLGDDFSGLCFGADPVIGPDGNPVIGADGNVMVSNACVAACEPAAVNPATGAVTAAALCENPNSTCQATGVIGAAGTVGVCIPGTTFSAASDCPSGTIGVLQDDTTGLGGAIYDCVPPSGIECNGIDAADGAMDMSNLGTACTFSHDGNDVSGVCFGAAPGGLACVDVCMPASVSDVGAVVPATLCANTNSTCQATGVIGAAGTGGVCIPGNTFTDVAQCPSGTHGIDQGDGTVDCVPPSGIECNGIDAADGAMDMSNLGTACTFSHDGNDVSGVCFGAAPGGLACVDVCMPASVDPATGQVVAASLCANSSSSCQATGVIGAAGTAGVCIPGDTFSAASECPSGTIGVDQGDGTVDCVPPSGIECNGADIADNGQFDLSNLGSACTFSHDGNDVSGVCFGAAPGELACVDVCMPASVSSAGALVAATLCANTNSSCQATGVIGAATTIGVCIPGDTFSAASECPSGTIGVDQGDGTVDCVPPSGIECNAIDASDGAMDMSNIGTACSFSHDGNTVNGVCFGAAPGELACVDVCMPASVSSAGAVVAATLCPNSNSTCQATGVIGLPTTAGVCIPGNTFTDVAQCPSGAHAVDQGDGTVDCVPPSGIECNGIDAIDGGGMDMSNLGTACTFSHDGNTVNGVCFGAAPGEQACIATCGAAGMANFYTAGSRETCTNTNSVCQPSGAVGDPTTLGLCIPDTSACSAAVGAEDAACAAASFSCNSGGQCVVPSIISCITGVDGSGDYTYAATGAQCVVDGDLDSVNDADEMGRCVPTGVGSVAVCLPDCSAGTCDAYDIAGTNDYYCQSLEAVGTGLLENLAGGGDGSGARDDYAACIPASSACSANSDCSTASSVGCDTAQGICLTPSLSACAAGGVPSAATAGTPCDSDGGGSNDGYCVPTTDTTGNGVPDSIQACLKSCTPDGGAGNCGTSGAVCYDFTGGANLYICASAP